VGGIPLLVALLLVLLYIHLLVHYLDYLVRIFEEQPLFIIPRGQPVPDAEEVWFPALDGVRLHGCYLRNTAPERRGVILFGLEFGSTCWACVPYCEDLLSNGFDVFSFEPRSQGESEHRPGYEPLQWVTDFEVDDVRAALRYLKSRSDAADGVGFFGISKGGSAGLLAAADDAYLRCFVTDGVFATYTTMVPYMRKWIAIYSERTWLHWILPDWYYGLVGRAGLRRIERERTCRFPHLERVVGRLVPRPWLMIHGGGDTYIKPEMAAALFDRAAQPKEFWIVPEAKHNQSLHAAGPEYRRRVLEFFQRHLAIETERQFVPSAAEQPTGSNGEVRIDPPRKTESGRRAKGGSVSAPAHWSSSNP
jgi:alpha-beta hydrolase superfamily lysophospholipase